MQFSPYLSFDGTCAEAFRFYEQRLGGKIVMMMTYGESPMADSTPAEARDRIMHVSLVRDGTLLMGGDSPPGRNQKMQGMHVSIMLKDTVEAERIFAALSEGGAVQMPLAETFWAARFGMVADKFGTAWMVNCEKAA